MSKEELVEQILTTIKPTVDFGNATAIIDDGVLDSLEFMNLISELSERFGIEVDVDDIVPENFNSIESIAAMVNRLQA